MFIEVYVIPAQDWTEPSKISKKPENRILLNVRHITDIRPSLRSENRADIQVNNVQLTVVGSYDEIALRVAKVSSLASVDGKIEKASDEEIFKKFGFTQETPE